MSVETKTMIPVISLLSLFILHMHDGADAFHVDKPMIYINFFDEVLSDNTSSKFTEKNLHTTSSPSNNTSVKNVTQRLGLSNGLLGVSDENRTSGEAPHDSIFEFDNPSKTDITDMNESVDPTTTSRFNDLVDTDFLEPEITRIFFLKAITNLIEHIMEALFSIDETPKLIDSPGFDYDLPPSRNLKKRDLQNAEDPSVEHKTETKTNTPESSLISAEVKHEKKNSESPAVTQEAKLVKINEILTKNLTEIGSNTSSTTLVTDNISSHNGDRETTVIKSHTSTGEEDPKPTTVIKSHHDVEVLPNRKIIHREQFVAHKNPMFANEEKKKMSQFSDGSVELNDEVVNNKDAHFYEGVHPAEYHEGYKLDDHFTNEEDDFNNYKDSSSLVTLLLIAMTMLILLILVGVGLGAAYLFYRNQSQSGNQNASNLRTAVA